MKRMLEEKAVIYYRPFAADRRRSGGPIVLAGHLALNH